MPATKKKNGIPMRAMIAMCFLLGTLAVLYSHLTGGTSEALLLGQNQAASRVYDPNQDYCFADTDNPGKYCWFCFDDYPYGNWEGVTGAAAGDCGSICHSVHNSDAVTVSTCY